MRFAVAARDIYHEDDFYGLEVVESDSPDEARSKSQFNMADGLVGLSVWIYEVEDGTELGWHDVLLPAKVYSE